MAYYCGHFIDGSYYQHIVRLSLAQPEYNTDLDCSALFNRYCCRIIFHKKKNIFKKALIIFDSARFPSNIINSSSAGALMGEMYCQSGSVDKAESRIRDLLATDLSERYKREKLHFFVEVAFR